MTRRQQAPPSLFPFSIFMAPSVKAWDMLGQFSALSAMPALFKGTIKKEGGEEVGGGLATSYDESGIGL